MAEPGGMVAPLTFAYGAALAGCVAGLAARAWSRRSGHTPSLLEAGWCVFLPVLAVLLVPLAAALQPHPTPPLGAAHALWHQWVERVHGSPAAHGALHWANWVVLGTGAVLLGRTIYALSQLLGFESAVRKSARRAEAGNLYTLNTSRPLCFTLGLLRPSVYVTSGLREQLSPRELEAMLAHEAAHVRRRDTLVGAVLTLFYTLLPLPGSRVLLRDWRRAVERACDQEAARALRSSCDVAAALVRVAQLLSPATAQLPNAPCFTEWGEDVEGRVQALLQLPAPSGRWTAGALASGTLGLVLTAALWLPHAVELFAHH